MTERLCSQDAGTYLSRMDDTVMNDTPQDASEPRPLTEETVRNALRRVKDPEAGINIVDLGLVYDIAIEDTNVDVKMTLTSPGCPAGGQILGESEQVVRGLTGVEDVKIELVWEPFWTPERIDPKVRAFLGF